MSNNDAIAAAEAYAFLDVVAPKLEQLRKRLAVANGHLKASDPDQGRLNAIIETQLAFKDFLASLVNLSPLGEPIDLLLEALREEAMERPELEPVKTEPPPPPPLAVPPAQKNGSTPMWLRVGTAIMAERLIGAGMTVTSAHVHLANVFASVGLCDGDGSPISDQIIKQWRTKVIGPAASVRGRQKLMKRRVGSGAAQETVAQVKERVAELAVIFRQMARWETG